MTTPVCLLDVNVVLYLNREDMAQHRPCRDWLDALESEGGIVAATELALSGFIRIATNPRIFPMPTPLDRAFAFVEELKKASHFTLLEPGPRHWPIFKDLCCTLSLRGTDISDAFHAAVAIEQGATWVSADAGFKRYPGLRWVNPLKAVS